MEKRNASGSGTTRLGATRYRQVFLVVKGIMVLRNEFSSCRTHRWWERSDWFELTGGDGNSSHRAFTTTVSRKACQNAQRAAVVAHPLQCPTSAARPHRVPLPSAKNWKIAKKFEHFPPPFSSVPCNPSAKNSIRRTSSIYLERWCHQITGLNDTGPTDTQVQGGLYRKLLFVWLQPYWTCYLHQVLRVLSKSVGNILLSITFWFMGLSLAPFWNSPVQKFRGATLAKKCIFS